MKRIIFAIIIGLITVSMGLWGVIGSVLDIIKDSFRPVDHVAGVIISSLFAFLGIHTIRYVVKRNKLEKTLIDSGRLVIAKIDDIVVTSWHPTISGHLVAKHNNQVYKSRNLTAKEHSKARTSDFVDVYVDKLNPDVYFVDLDSL